MSIVNFDIDIELIDSLDSQPSCESVQSCDHPAAGLLVPPCCKDYMLCITCYTEVKEWAEEDPTATFICFKCHKGGFVWTDFTWRPL